MFLSPGNFTPNEKLSFEQSAAPRPAPGVLENFFAPRRLRDRGPGAASGAFADLRKGDIGMQLGEIARANPGVGIGSYPFFDPQRGPNTNVVLRAHDAQKLAQAKRAVEDMVERVRRAHSLALSRRKHGFESPRERQ
jgi:hypothetical protein